MINNWNYQKLRMDFSSMYDGNAHPSDIDMLYIGKDNTLIIGEIKNECGKLTGGQRKLMESICKGWKYDAICLFITHNKYVQNGDTSVDVSNCNIVEYFYNKDCEWHIPRKATKVKEIIDKYKC